jgi:dephospho-CoA kinase
VHADGALDRARCARLVFSRRPPARKLEAILHPLIRARARAGSTLPDAPYVLLVVPLLLETGAYRDS